MKPNRRTDSSARWRAAAALLGVLALAAALRLYQIGAWPAGLHPDEAAEGLDALRILNGSRPVYLPENRGREPLFAYLAAGSIAVWGRTPGAIRLVGALADVAAAAAAYLAVASLFGRRAGLAAAFFYTVSVWPILASRFGVRWSLLPPLLGLILWQGALAWKTGRRGHWLAAGALLGVAAYSYTALRVFPLFLLLAGGVAALRGRLKQLWPGAGLGLVAAGMMALPLISFALTNPEAVFGRSAEASILREGTSPGALAAQTYQVLQMFLFSGDWNPRQDIWTPGLPATPRPVFDWAAGAAFVLGHLAALRSWKQPRVWLAYLWLGVMLLPTVLSDEAPHFGRAIGILPILFAWPALGAFALKDWLGGRLGRVAALVFPACLLSLSAWFTFRDLWLRDYLAQPWLAAGYYGGPATAVAVEVNRFLGEGWDGASLRARPAGSTARRVLIDEGLTRTAAYDFLVGRANPAVSVLAEGEPWPGSLPPGVLLILPADAPGASTWANSFGGEARVCEGGWGYSPPGNQRGAPLYLAYRVVPAGELQNCAPG